jgi:hypothetical protein
MHPVGLWPELAGPLGTLGSPAVAGLLSSRPRSSEMAEGCREGGCS